MRKTIIAFALGTLLSGGSLAAVKYQSVTVRPGDTLWSIANKYLKDPQRWSVILQHNKMPTKELTVPLPGMTLKIPVIEIKESLRAATLVEAKNQVEDRKKNSAGWVKSVEGKDLFDGDGIRTLARSWAKVQFFEGAPLSISPNSLAILKSPKVADHELELKKGTIHSTVARVVTPSARVFPKGRDTKYTVGVQDDLSTKVQVFKGSAEVQDSKGRNTMEVKAGFQSVVALDSSPTIPSRIPKAELAKNMTLDIGTPSGGSAVAVRTGGLRVSDGDSLQAELESLSVGIPVAAYRVQISREAGARSFEKPLLDKKFDVYQRMDLSNTGLPNGSYFVRMAVIDLLGDEGSFSKPRPFLVGAAQKARSLAFQGDLKITRPASESVKVSYRRFRISGNADAGLSVKINGERISTNAAGEFSKEVRLSEGLNTFEIEAVDQRGNATSILRKITYAR